MLLVGKTTKTFAEKLSIIFLKRYFNNHETIIFVIMCLFYFDSTILEDKHKKNNKNIALQVMDF